MWACLFDPFHVALVLLFWHAFLTTSVLHSVPLFWLACSTHCVGQSVLLLFGLAYVTFRVATCARAWACPLDPLRVALRAPVWHCLFDPFRVALRAPVKACTFVRFRVALRAPSVGPAYLTLYWTSYLIHSVLQSVLPRAKQTVETQARRNTRDQASRCILVADWLEPWLKPFGSNPWLKQSRCYLLSPPFFLRIRYAAPW